MGTNYYLHLVSDEGFCTILHIGKSSVGWKFLFRGHADLDLNSVEDWRTRTRQGNIFNEYDDKTAYDTFWSLVRAKKSGRYTGKLVDGYPIHFYEFS